MASKKTVKKKSPAKKSKPSVGVSWAPFKRGDIIDVIAPGFCPTDDEVEAGVQFLESWGLQPRLPHDLFGADVLCSNTDEKRMRHLAHGLLAKDSVGVWCLRGGYGANRLVPGLLKLKKPSRAKIMLGLSDVTTLQLFLQLKWKWPSLQVPVLARMACLMNPKVAESSGLMPIDTQVEELRRVLFGETSTVLHEGLRRIGGLPPKAEKANVIRGEMIGGNLVTFASALGTAISPKTDGRIVYFEEVGERGYRIDRLLEQFIQAGVLTAKTKAIVFGEFVGGLEKDGTSKITGVIERFASTWARENKIPVLTGIASGHGLNQRIVPLGTNAVLDLRSGSLEIETAVQHPRGR